MEICVTYITGGVIGNAENVETDLSENDLQQYCFTDETYDLKECINTSLSFLELADYSITMPILATVYISVLKSILHELGMLIDYVLYVQGQSGTRKSSITAVGLSHFGQFDRDGFPTSFKDSFNSIEKKAFILKDILFVTDDFCPERMSLKALATAESIFGMFGDRNGRTRMAQDGKTLKKAYKARGVGIITGEMLPETAQSRVARTLIVNIEKNSINLHKLSELQENTKKLAFNMMWFIAWIIENITYVKKYLKENFKNNRQASISNSNVHGRTSEIGDILPLGFTLFTQFAQEKDAILLETKNELDTKMYEVMHQLITEQTREVQELKPTELFYNGFVELIQSKTINVTDIQFSKMIGGGTNVGYYDSDKKVLYLFKNVYNEVAKFYNNKFPIPEKTLWKYLYEEGLLHKNNNGNYQVPRTLYKKSYRVLEIDASGIADVLYQPDPNLKGERQMDKMFRENRTF